MKNRTHTAARLALLTALPTMSLATAFAAGPLGPPAASLAKGQFGAGVEYSYGELGLDLSDGRDNAGTRLPSFHVDAFTMHTVDATLSYGILGQWEVGAKAGANWGAWDLRGNNFDGDAGPSVGGYTRGSFYRHGKLEVGGVFHFDWDQISGDNQGPGWVGDTDLEFFHLRLAVGPRYNVSRYFGFYAGPFWQHIDGEKRYDERVPVPGYKERYDVEARSNWGGFLGVEASLSDHIRLGADAQLTPHDWIVGGSFRWLW